LDRVAHDLAESVKRIPRAGGPAGPPAGHSVLSEPPTAPGSEPAVTPRTAFLGASEAVAVEAAVGRISTEAIAGYPPGVPTLLPGELVTAEVVAYLQALVAAGARLHGATDPSLRTLRVLA
jgi:arginine decarboxylase